MSHTFPIERDTSLYRKITVIGYRAFVVLFFGPVAAAMLVCAMVSKNHNWLFYAPISAGSVALAYVICRYVIRGDKPDTLSIGAFGIKFTKAGIGHEYSWHEIAKTRVVVLERNSKTRIEGVQIQRKGAFYPHDDISDSIQPQKFNLGLQDFRSIVEEGVAKWGAGIATSEQIEPSN